MGPKHLWSQAHGGASFDYSYDLAVDGAGNIYLTGYFTSPANFGGPVLSSGANHDIFLASYTSTGKHRWSKGFGSGNQDHGKSLALDAAGKTVYLTGHIDGSVNFGGTTLDCSGPRDIFVAAFTTSSGGHVWSKRFGGSGHDQGNGIAVGGGDLYLSGQFDGTMNLGGSNLVNSGSGSDIFLASFTSTGEHRWSKRFGSSNTDRGRGVIVDGAANVYFTGEFMDGADLGGSTLVNQGVTDIFVASYTSLGKHRWSASYGSPSTDYGQDLALGASGDLYAIGHCNGVVTFGATTLSHSGQSDFILASYTTAGARRWARSFGGTSLENGLGVAVDGAGDIFVTGTFHPPVDFGGGAITGKPSLDIIVASYTKSGAHRWSLGFGDDAHDTGTSIAVTGGAIYVTGVVNSGVSFGGAAVGGLGHADVFLLKLAP